MEVHKARRRAPSRPVIAVILLVAILLSFVFWRRSVLLATMEARRSTTTTPRLSSAPSTTSTAPQLVVHTQHPVPQFPDAPASSVFALNITAERYPSLGEFLKMDNGTYKGIGFDRISHDSPRAYLLYNTLTTSECAELVQFAADQMARSEVVHSPGQSAVNSVRTSFGMFIMKSVPADERLRNQVAAIAGVPLVNIEATQILRYKPGQFYRPHPDFFYENAREHLARGGQRIATALTWLNDVHTGGETRFPNARPAPITLKQTGVGNSIFFYSVDEAGMIDFTSTHEAIPPGEGSEKWVAVNWIRQREFH